MLNGKRLTVARLRRGHSKRTLANMLGVTDRTVFNWEQGVPTPDLFTVSKLADVLGFPEEFFTADDPHLIEPEVVSFRAMKSMRAIQRDSTLAAGAIAVEVSDWLENHFSLPTCAVPDLSDCSPEVAAVVLRNEWKLGNKPVTNMVHLLESKGVRVFSLSQKGDEIDACSTWVNGTPFVFLNSFKSPERSRFDSAHELAHLCLHKHGAPSGREAEQEADTFARYFLMPEAAIRAQAPNLVNMTSLFKIKKRWIVSVAATAYHLHKLGILTEWHYRQLAIEIQSRGYRKSEPDSARKETSLLWSKVLRSLREDGHSQVWLAEQLRLPSSELFDLLFGLVTTPVHSEGSPVMPTAPKRGHLRLVSGS